MMATLVLKLLRDVRLGLLVVMALLGAFQVLWYRVIQRILGELSPFFNQLASAGGLTQQDVENVVFDGPGKIVRTIIGGERLAMDRAMDLLSIGYVHPLVQTILCIWAVGRAAGAIAGEIDRGTMELLLAQPLARTRLVLAHFCVDLLVIPCICASLWVGNYVGLALIGPIEIKPTPGLKQPTAGPAYLLELGPLRVRLASPLGSVGGSTDPNAVAERERKIHERLQVDPSAFGAAAAAVAGLVFAVSGLTLWISSAGRYRYRVLGLAVMFVLVQFLVNVIGQLDAAFAWMRPLTLFYYYQPQQMVLGKSWNVTFAEWNGNEPMLHVPAVAVLFAVGALGYVMALFTFTRRDIPAPL